MFELEKLLINHSHPIIKDRIEHLVKLQHGFLDSNGPNIASFNLFEQGIETIFDHDGFVYKLYFTAESYTEGGKRNDSENKENSQIKEPPTNVHKKFNKPFYLVMEVYNTYIRQLWNDAKQLIEHYRNLASNDIEIYEPHDMCDCLLIYLPSSAISEIFSDFKDQKILNSAFEMVTSSIKSSLHCGSVLNVIRYMSFYCSLDKKAISEEAKIEDYSLIYMTLLSNKKIHAFYPDSKNKHQLAILAVENLDKQKANNILVGNFIRELSNAISQSEILALKNQLGFEMITISFSNTLPKNADEFFLSQKSDIISCDESFVIFCIPVSWLKSTGDNIKLHLAGFITLINNMLLQMIPQCKSAVRCGLRKHVLELTNQECEGY